jgi:hypothetical protein
MPAPGDYDDGEIGGMIGKGNRSTRRKPAPVPLCPPQTPHAARTQTRAAAVGSQRLNAWTTARPCLQLLLLRYGATWLQYLLVNVPIALNTSMPAVRMRYVSNTSAAGIISRSYQTLYLLSILL